MFAWPEGQCNLPNSDIVPEKHKQTYQEAEIGSYHRHFLEQHDANAPLQQFCREHWKGTDKNRGRSWKHLIKLPDNSGTVAPIVVNLFLQDSSNYYFSKDVYGNKLCLLVLFCYSQLKKAFILLKMQILVNKNAQKLKEIFFFKRFKNDFLLQTGTFKICNCI